jgi:hypothetical protein
MLHRPVILFDTDTWIVLTRASLSAVGPFSNRENAERFAASHGGIAATWYEPEGMCEGWDHQAAIWFNGDWDAPFIIGGPFFDCEDVKAVCGTESGITITLEWPDDDDDDDNDDIGGQNRAA